VDSLGGCALVCSHTFGPYGHLNFIQKQFFCPDITVKMKNQCLTIKLIHCNVCMYCIILSGLIMFLNNVPDGN
jgi:hypothetical protein